LKPDAAQNNDHLLYLNTNSARSAAVNPSGATALTRPPAQAGYLSRWSKDVPEQARGQRTVQQALVSRWRFPGRVTPDQRLWPQDHI